MGNESQRVQWYEGMLLEPQHFQQMQLDLHALSLKYLKISNPFYWGIQSLKIDEAALVAGTFRILEISAIFPDGSNYAVAPTDNQYPELDINSLKDINKNDPLLISLGIVRYRPDAANTQGDYPRYLSIQVGPIVDENTGQSGLYMPKLTLKAEILGGENIPTRYISFPVARVVYRDDGYILDKFIPPRTDIAHGTDLSTLCCDHLSYLREKINFLSTKLQSHITASNQPLFEAYQSFYNILCPLVPRLEALVNAQHTHPFTVYCELSWIAGEVARMISGSIPPIFPVYNHNDILSVYTNVITYIQEHVNLVKRMSLSLAFQQSGNIYALHLNEQWVWQNNWVIGLQVPPNISPKEVTNWLQGTIIASEKVVPSLREKRTLGASRTVVDEVPEFGLLPKENMLFVLVENNPNFIIPNTTLVLTNPGDSDLSRPSQVLLFITDTPQKAS